MPEAIRPVLPAPRFGRGIAEKAEYDEIRQQVKRFMPTEVPYREDCFIWNEKPSKLFPNQAQQEATDDVRQAVAQARQNGQNILTLFGLHQNVKQPEVFAGLIQLFAQSALGEEAVEAYVIPETKDVLIRQDYQLNELEGAAIPAKHLTEASLEKIVRESVKQQGLTEEDWPVIQSLARKLYQSVHEQRLMDDFVRRLHLPEQSTPSERRE